MKTFVITSMILTIALEAANPINAPMALPVTENVTVLQSKSDKELAWVDEQIQAILPARIGVADGYINSLNDPIRYVSSKPISNSSGIKLLPPPRLGSMPMLPGMPIIVKTVEEPLRLQGLMNKSALINGKWYRINDTVRSYTLTEIKPSSILLSAPKDQKLILFISKQNTNIKINTK
ncbi:MAG: hypothetical protein M1300_04350 [Epsilonproteobacteria bacterium]|nr:hypothetical protein [Campylobacterota bacterium]